MVKKVGNIIRSIDLQMVINNPQKMWNGWKKNFSFHTNAIIDPQVFSIFPIFLTRIADEFVIFKLLTIRSFDIHWISYVYTLHDSAVLKNQKLLSKNFFFYFCWLKFFFTRIYCFHGFFCVFPEYSTGFIVFPLFRLISAFFYNLICGNLTWEHFNWDVKTDLRLRAMIFGDLT